MLHRYAAGRALHLVDRLAEVLQETPPDPFTPEWLATPSEGMRRWVLLELAARLGTSGPGLADGVCANVERAFADSLRRALLAADGSDWRTDPWSPSRLAWPMLEVLAEEPLSSRLGVPRFGQVTRYGLARQVADRFDRYHLHRPAMVRAWADGLDVDGAGKLVAEDLAWQPKLWRAVRERVGIPSLPERWPNLLDRLREGELALELPPRLCIFGFSQLPAGDFLELVCALCRWREIHLFLVEPTIYPRDLLRADRGSTALRAAVGDSFRAFHPLLRSWGRPQLETAILLAEAEGKGLPPARTVGGSIAAERDLLLSRLQDDIRANRPPQADLVPRADDRSVQFHACYGPGRQVAALRDAVLHLLADEPGLREEDVLVLCPALDRFTPLVETVLGPSAAAGSISVPDDVDRPPALRYRIVDKSVAGGNEVIDAALHLLDLVSGRFEASDLLQLINRPPVRARLGFDEEELEVVGRWVEATNVRWGLDPVHRSRFGLPPEVTSNTWQQALDRLLIGCAVDANDLAVATAGVAPFAVDAGREGCVGRLAYALRLLGGLAGATASPRPVREWIALVTDAFRSLLAASSSALSWQMDALERALGEAREAAGGASPSPVPLEFAEFRRFLGEHLRPAWGRNDFFRGGVTVTSLDPLRWVPFRVVCLLGMDETSLARGHPAGDDLLQAPPMVGDPDQRSDLRQALLDAVLAAEDHLLVFRDGRSPRSNQPVPPAVAVDELREAVLATVPSRHRDEVARRLEIEHPCHPFDERCFTVGGLVEGRRWGFGRGDLEGALARCRRRPSSRPFLDVPLEPLPGEVIDLDDLYAFLENPMSWFLARRLGVRVPRGSARTDTGLPVNPGPLSTWQIGNRLLQARLDGHSVDAWRRHEAALGTLPPGVLAEQLLADVEEQVDDLVGLAAAAGVLAGSREAVPIDVRLPDGSRIAGEIPCTLGSGEPGTAILTYSREKPTHRLRAWIDLMSLSVARPEIAWRSVVVSRRATSRGAAGCEYVLAQPAGTDVPPAPLECLDFAAQLFRLGSTEPLPIFPKVSFSLFKNPSSAPGLWRDRGRTESRAPCEGDEPFVELVLGRSSFEDLLALPARDGDPGFRGERSRAKRLARELYRKVARSMRERNLVRRQGGRSG